MNKVKAFLIPEECSLQFSSDFVKLNTELFVPSKSIVGDYEGSKFEEIFTFAFLERTDFLRDTLKKLDSLLKVGGNLVIDYYTVGQLYSGGHYVRPLSFFLYELSLSLGKRFKLISKDQKDTITKFIFEKVSDGANVGGSIYSWSFGIVSDGKKDDRIFNIVRQIREFKIPNYEILICGPQPKFDLGKDIVWLDDSDLYWDLRIPITAKKNRIIYNASYNNLVLLHDRISFSEDWYEKVKKYGNTFEILANKVFDEETQSLRVQDWMHYERDFTDFLGIKAGALSYLEWNPTVYVDGGFIIAKTSILKSIDGYNESLHWGEAEDVDLSKRLYQAGYMTNIDTNNIVFTQTHRHVGISINRKKKKFFYKLYNFIRFYLNTQKQKNKYLIDINNLFKNN
ncbi:hypothetical protein [Flectobacillus rivi]|uniref:Uncharacterized protein n=1 Tax=Flectobacillus rivi TaxID=2984209 RepID=A0ABT6YWV5_9BACT|nr:hypothetical protein [Flectobacillus rivi]MDI9873365.1 hypothetical protein [Flectobacillus rivi]